MRRDSGPVDLHRAAVVGQNLTGSTGVAVRLGRCGAAPVSYTHLRAHETVLDLVCRLLLEKKKKTAPGTKQPHNRTITTTPYTQRITLSTEQDK